MTGHIAALYRHPIKGFTPQKVSSAYLTPRAAFPGDRLFAIEDGPSGFDPAKPVWITKQRFAVLAKIAEVARAAFAAWVGALLGQAASGSLCVVTGGGHRFLDHPAGHVSIINLASVRDFAQRPGATSPSPPGCTSSTAICSPASMCR